MGTEQVSQAVENDPMWEDVLLRGHGWPKAVRGAFRRLPSSPRCKVCASPFSGVGGTIMRPFGFRPSRKNPNFCGRCIDMMPAGGAEVDIAVLFADVRGSTTLGESLGATAYAGLMHRFYGVATDVLLAHDAVIDKLIGDEVMALFIPGITGPAYRQRAVDAGLDLLRAVKDGDSAWLPVGVAVHGGRAFVGNVGGQGITDFTALGDMVNTASRLQGFATAGELVVSEALCTELGEIAPTGETRTVEVRGRTEPLAVRVVRGA
jgi:adenylate cyclase